MTTISSAGIAPGGGSGILVKPSCASVSTADVLLLLELSVLGLQLLGDFIPPRPLRLQLRHRAGTLCVYVIERVHLCWWLNLCSAD